MAIFRRLTNGKSLNLFRSVHYCFYFYVCRKKIEIDRPDDDIVIESSSHFRLTLEPKYNELWHVNDHFIQSIDRAELKLAKLKLAWSGWSLDDIRACELKLALFMTLV